MTEWHERAVWFARDEDRALRVGVVGCGDHAWRNIARAFAYAPVRLAAVADLDEDRSRSFAKQFGATRHSHVELLDEEDLDAAFVIAGYIDDAPAHPQIAVDCVDAGVHVWIEKPPAASVAEITQRWIA